MSNVGGHQRKRLQTSRFSSTTTMQASTANAATTQPTRANSIAAMPFSIQSSRNFNANCDCGTGNRRKRLSTEVWDPFQPDSMAPGKRSSKDLLHAINQQRQAHTDAGCRSPRLPPPPPPRNPGDSGESDLDNGRRTCEFLYDMWCQQKLCDVILRCCGDGNTEDTIYAHKVVLAAYSEYLFHKFTEFPSSEVISIDLTQYPPIAVFAVLRFVYTGELEITQETVGYVWKIAEFLGICTIVGLCEDYLGEPSVDNAIYHFAVAERFGLTNLGCTIYQFIVERFLDVSQTSEFTFLPPDRICQLLSDDMLIVNNELDVFCALVRWLDYDRDGRLCQAAHLLQDAVRLHCISPECIVSKVETVDWLFDAVPECQVVTNEAMRSVSFVPNRKSVHGLWFDAATAAAAALA